MFLTMLTSRCRTYEMCKGPWLYEISALTKTFSPGLEENNA